MDRETITRCVRMTRVSTLISVSMPFIILTQTNCLQKTSAFTTSSIRPLCLTIPALSLSKNFISSFLASSLLYVLCSVRTIYPLFVFVLTLRSMMPRIVLTPHVSSSFWPPYTLTLLPFFLFSITRTCSCNHITRICSRICDSPTCRSLFD